MEVYRISREAYAKELTASGRSNRWNFDDEFLIYAGSSRSLASLEMIVHRNSIVPAIKYKLMVISIADEEALFNNLLLADLPVNWRSMAAYPQLQKLGSDWYQSKRSMVLRVPSAVIPKEYNFIINTRHPDFLNKDKIALVRTEDYFWDDRIFEFNV